MINVLIVVSALNASVDVFAIISQARWLFQEKWDERDQQQQLRILSSQWIVNIVFGRAHTHTHTLTRVQHRIWINAKFCEYHFSFHLFSFCFCFLFSSAFSTQRWCALAQSSFFSAILFLNFTTVPPPATHEWNSHNTEYFVSRWFVAFAAPFWRCVTWCGPHTHTHHTPLERKKYKCTL